MLWSSNSSSISQMIHQSDKKKNSWQILQYNDLLFDTEQRESNWKGGESFSVSVGEIINLINFHHGNRKSNCQTARVV